jgi:uncharacterized protein DUF3301
MFQIALFGAAGLAGGLVFDTLRAREAAVAVAKAVCQRQGLQFLDDTVRGLRTRVGRDGEGRAVSAGSLCSSFPTTGSVATVAA